MAIKRRSAVRQGGQTRFNRGVQYHLVGPSGHSTLVRVLDQVHLTGRRSGRRGLLIQVDKRSRS
jgi:hypothetical protein